MSAGERDRTMISPGDFTRKNQGSAPPSLFLFVAKITKKQFKIFKEKIPKF